MNHLEITGESSIGIQDVINCDINITQIIGRSSDYKEISEAIRTQKLLIKLLPEDDLTERDIANTKLEILYRECSFKEDILLLAQQFEKIDLSDARLVKAKEHFDNGRFNDAAILLDAKSLESEQKDILRRKKHVEAKVAELAAKSKLIADEYYLMALMNNAQNGNIGLTRKYLDLSIRLYPGFINTFICGYFLERSKEFSIAITYYIKALKTTDGKKPVNKIFTYNKIGQVYMKLNDHKNALLFYNKSINAAQSFTLKDERSHWWIADATNNIGEIYNIVIGPEQGLKYLLSALAMRNIDLIPNDINYYENYVINLRNIAACYVLLYQWENAIKYLLLAHQQTELTEKIFPKERRKVYFDFTTLCTAGFVYSQNGNNQTALDYFKLAFKLYGDSIYSSSANYKGLAKQLTRYGEVFFKLNEYLSALQQYEKAIQVIEHSYTYDKSFITEYVNAKTKMAETYFFFKKKDRCTALLADVMVFYNLHHSDKHLTDFDSVAFSMINVGELFNKLKEPENAKAGFKTALQLFQKVQIRNDINLRGFLQAANSLLEIAMEKESISESLIYLDLQIAALEDFLLAYPTKKWEIYLGKCLIICGYFNSYLISNKSIAVEFAEKGLAILTEIEDDGSFATYVEKARIVIMRLA